MKALRTRRLTLRPQTPADAARVFELLSRRDVAVPLGSPLPRSVASIRAAIRAETAARRRPGARWAYSLVTRAGEWAGILNLRWPHKGVAELGYGVHPSHQGRGYATEAVRAAAAYAFRLGAHRVQATCWTRNPASMKVLRRAGLKKEGVLRGYLRRGRVVRDECMFGLARRDRRSKS